MTSINDIVVEELTPKQIGRWKAFLEVSSNGTLFHDLDFLSYHSVGRFSYHHLIFKSKGKLLALFPAGIKHDKTNDRKTLMSPVGASVGGLVLPPRARLLDVIGIVEALKKYAVSRGFDSIEMRLGPSFYATPPNDLLGFALASRGFILAKRWLTYAFRLPKTSEDLFQNLKNRLRTYVMKGLREGVSVRLSEKGTLEKDLYKFYHILVEDRKRLAATPTHNYDELYRLFTLLPGRLKLFLCEFHGEAIGGNLIFELNSRVVNLFYPCQLQEFANMRPNLMTSVHVWDYYLRSGFSWADLGPATFDDYSVNTGVAAFKERMGCDGFCRDLWRWNQA